MKKLKNMSTVRAFIFTKDIFRLFAKYRKRIPTATFTSPNNRVAAGPFVRYRVDLGEQLELIVNHPNEGQARLARGARVSLSWPEQAIHRLHSAHQGAQS